MTVTLERQDGSTVCERCLLAETPLTRMRGLLGRSSFPVGEGLLLRPAASIHTAFMRFAIDVVFLDSNDRVVKVVGSLPPWRMAACKGARAALELPPGEAARNGIAAGMSLTQVWRTAGAQRPRVLPSL